MDWVRIGRSIRALRRRRRMRQADLASAAGCSQALISRIERGRGDVVLPRTFEAIARAMGARVVTNLDWNGEALDRLLDADHASIVDAIVKILRSAGWETRTEVTFAIGAERGSVDVLAWHPTAGNLLVVEVKSVVPDAQDTLAKLDRKGRLAPRFVPTDWRPRAISSLLVIGDTRTNRRRIAALDATFDAAFPDRIAAIRRFLASPGDQTSLRGLWFLPISTTATARHRVRAS
jgi:transcriptional regulator with XRE-family HTH domain